MRDGDGPAPPEAGPGGDRPPAAGGGPTREEFVRGALAATGSGTAEQWGAEYDRLTAARGTDAVATAS